MCPFEIELMQLQSQSKFQVLRYDHDQLLPKKNSRINVQEIIYYFFP